jgi:hypothetical protein
MCCEKGVDDTFAVTERHASLVVLPVERCVGRVRPHEVVKQAIVWDVCGSAICRAYSSPVGRVMRLISSMLLRLGLRPPWTQKILLATMDAMGRVLKTSMNVFHVLMLVLRLHSS